MKKVPAAIFFLLIYLSAYTELHQFLRLPLFFIHFAEHRKEITDLKLKDYIIIHYLTSEPKGADSERHHELPFKANHTQVLVSFTLPDENSFYKFLNTPLKVEPIITRNSLFVASSFVTSIWQPPRA